jgi:hypothetical protein
MTTETELSERLRGAVQGGWAYFYRRDGFAINLFSETADAIDRLRAELDEARAALIAAKAHILLLRGDTRADPFGDRSDKSVLDEIDAALAPTKEGSAE